MLATGDRGQQLFSVYTRQAPQQLNGPLLFHPPESPVRVLL